MDNQVSKIKSGKAQHSLDNKVLEEIPPNKLLRLAYEAYKTNRYEDSMTYICMAEKRRGKLSLEVSKKLDYLKGDVLLDMKLFKEAVKCYSQILKREKTEVAFCNKALSLWELNRFRSALNNYLKAIELNPANEISHRGAGEMYLKINKPILAVAHFQMAIKLKSKYVEAITGLGVALLRMKEWAKSYRLFEQALAIDPTDALAKKWLSALDKALSD